MEIITATTHDQIQSCYLAFKELRPHLAEDSFVQQVLRQQTNHNYTLVYLEVNHLVVAAAGFRIAEYLAWGKTFYVDDLITIESQRSKGYAKTLLNYLIESAKELQCDEFHLDSGTQRHEAHRLYKKAFLDINSFHFSRKLN